MRIAVVHHTNAATDYSIYITDIVKEAAANNGFELKTWSSAVPAAAQKVADNTLVFVNTEASSAFGFFKFYKLSLPLLLKKIKADVVFHLHGIAVSIAIKQLLVLHTDFVSANRKNLTAVDRYAQKHLQTFKSKAAQQIVYSDTLMRTFQSLFPATIKIPFTSPEIFQPFQWHDKIMVKARQADNREYFLSVCEDNNETAFVELLKAFSRFKNWQQSNMYLLVLPRYELFAPIIHHKLTTYKYKEEVRLLEGISEKELAAIVASAYAFVHVPLPNADVLAVTAAIQCAIPVVSYADADIAEYAGEAALSVANSFENLGDAMINIYKNEDLHHALAASAKITAEKFSRLQTTTQLWHLLTAQ